MKTFKDFFSESTERDFTKEVAFVCKEGGYMPVTTLTPDLAQQWIKQSRYDEKDLKIEGNKIKVLDVTEEGRYFIVLAYTPCPPAEVANSINSNIINTLFFTHNSMMENFWFGDLYLGGPTNKIWAERVYTTSQASIFAYKENLNETKEIISKWKLQKEFGNDIGQTIYDL